MTIKELKKELEKYEDDTPILTWTESNICESEYVEYDTFLKNPLNEYYYVPENFDLGDFRDRVHDYLWHDSGRRPSEKEIDSYLEENLKKVFCLSIF